MCNAQKIFPTRIAFWESVSPSFRSTLIKIKTFESFEASWTIAKQLGTVDWTDGVVQLEERSLLTPERLQFESRSRCHKRTQTSPIGFLNGLSPTSFPLISSFQTNITIFTPNTCEKCPSSIWCWDSNPQPSVHEFPPITTRPRLPPNTSPIVGTHF